MSVYARIRELDPLHPTVRQRTKAIVKRLADADIPLRPFETYRTPARQAHLYAIGRTKEMDRGRVTNAGPWQSFHQYGLAVDFVIYRNGKWEWTTDQETRPWWSTFHDIAREEGLELLSWELPHVQLPDLRYADLMAGAYPDGGDATWADNLTTMIEIWTGSDRPVPPAISGMELRPSRPHPRKAQETTVAPLTSDWTSFNGGLSWRADARGVYVKGHADGLKPLRSIGAPITCEAILDFFEDEIAAAAARFDVPVPLIMMTIAVETSIYRKHRFTGPHTFRWEPHARVGHTGNADTEGKRIGDYSAGPMQVLGSTVRWVIAAQDLAYNALETAPVFQKQPETPPAALPLYEPQTAIDLGAAVIRQRWSKTGADPIKVAAAYNSGGLYPSADLPWRLRAHGTHLQRAAEFYGDACAVLEVA